MESLEAYRSYGLAIVARDWALGKTVSRFAPSEARDVNMAVGLR